MQVSRRFIRAVREAPVRQYLIAHAAGLHPSTLSRILNGIDDVRENDRRVLAVARVLKLRPAECFRAADSSVLVPDAGKGDQNAG